MGSALYVVLDGEAPGLDPTVDGKALSGAEKILDRAARERGVVPLMDFFSMSEEDWDFLGEEVGDAGERPDDTAERWFDPDDGLRTVVALLAWLDENPGAVPGRVRDDLLAVRGVLEGARAHGLRWHLAVDV